MCTSPVPFIITFLFKITAFEKKKFSIFNHKIKKSVLFVNWNKALHKNAVRILAKNTCILNVHELLIAKCKKMLFWKNVS